VAVNALDVLAAASISAGRHTCHQAQRRELIPGGLMGVQVGAVGVVGALVAEEVHIAELHLLDTVDFGLIVVLARRIDALASAVTCN